MLRKFRNDPDYLTKYHLNATLLLLPSAVASFILTGRSPNQLLLFLPTILILCSPQIRTVLVGYVATIAVAYFCGQIDIYCLGLFVAGILVTFPVSGLMHATSHDSLRPRWLNRPVGEAMGLFHLVGYPDWKIIHVIHHSHADDSELDPHPPGNKSYWEFTKGMRTAAANAFVKYYLKHFSQVEKASPKLKKFSRVSKLDTLVRIFFWYCLLGPKVFTFFYASSLVFKMFHWAWFNWSTHRPTENGVQILNYSHGLYRFINAISLGLYYHQNHHLNPSLLNPGKLPRESVSRAA